MSNYELTKEIVTCKKQMKELTREFMKANDIKTADMKLDELVKMSTHVAELKAKQRETSLFTRIKTKLGL